MRNNRNRRATLALWLVVLMALSGFAAAETRSFTIDLATIAADGQNGKAPSAQPALLSADLSSTEPAEAAESDDGAAFAPEAAEAAGVTAELDGVETDEAYDFEDAFDDASDDAVEDDGFYDDAGDEGDFDGEFEDEADGEDAYEDDADGEDAYGDDADGDVAFDDDVDNEASADGETDDETEFDNTGDDAEETASEETFTFPVEITITAAGDTTLGGCARDKTDARFKKMAQKKGADYFLGGVRRIFESDDLTILNLEGTLTTAKDHRKGQYFYFKGNPKYVQILSGSSVDVCNLANNHTNDYGAEGLKQTQRTLKKAGIGYCGYDLSYTRTIKGVRVCTLGFTKWDHTAKDVKKAVKVARRECDILIVSMHWGEEKVYSADAEQRKLGHAAIDAGADLVIGTHPHVYGGIEKYKGKYIVYSLGNFCFGGNPNPTDKRCLIFQQTFSYSPYTGVSDAGINIIPAWVSSSKKTNNYRPTLMKKADGLKLLKAVAKHSKGMSAKNTVWMTENYLVWAGIATVSQLEQINTSVTGISPSSTEAPDDDAEEADDGDAFETDDDAAFDAEDDAGETPDAELASAKADGDMADDFADEAADADDGEAAFDLEADADEMDDASEDGADDMPQTDDLFDADDEMFEPASDSVDDTADAALDEADDLADADDIGEEEAFSVVTADDVTIADDVEWDDVTVEETDDDLFDAWPDDSGVDADMSADDADADGSEAPADVPEAEAAATDAADAWETVVYSVYSDPQYYHADELCEGQVNGRSLTLYEAVQESLEPCPVCNPPAPAN